MKLHTLGGIAINIVNPLRSTVNNTMLNAKLRVMINGRKIGFLSVDKEPLKITGSTGNTHGASTVSTPPIKEVKYKSIYTVLRILYYVSSIVCNVSYKLLVKSLISLEKLLVPSNACARALTL